MSQPGQGIRGKEGGRACRTAPHFGSENLQKIGGITLCVRLRRVRPFLWREAEEEEAQLSPCDQCRSLRLLFAFCPRRRGRVMDRMPCVIVTAPVHRK